MFIFSMKTTRPRIIAAVSVAAMLLLTMVTLSGNGAAVATSAPTAADDTARRQYLAELGYEVMPDRSEVREILIPAEFDETLTAYNQLQLQTGYDLTEYAGRRVKCWTYTVINYPQDDTVQAHLYIYKDKIIGGDISSTVQDGFSHGLKPMNLTDAA